MCRVHLWLFPQLRRIPDSERAAALRKARANPYDAFELLGIAAGLVVVTALTRYDGVWTGLGRVAAFCVNFAVALPLLGAFVGPLMVRRIRRGLDRQLRRESGR
jgi:hypothetical protein